MKRILFKFLSYLGMLYFRATLPQAYRTFIAKFSMQTMLERDEAIYLNSPFTNCSAVRITPAASRATVTYDLFIDSKGWTHVEAVLNPNRIDLKTESSWEELELSDPRAKPIRMLVLSHYQFPFLSPYMKQRLPESKNEAN